MKWNMLYAQFLCVITPWQYFVFLSDEFCQVFFVLKDTAILYFRRLKHTGYVGDIMVWISYC